MPSLRYERYHWLPARRTYIPKKNGTKRPLGMPVWSDKLGQEVIRLILQAYDEPQFSSHSHGFRPARSCATALRAIYSQWKGTSWFIAGDIWQCFDTLSHELLLEELQEHIHDGRFIKRVRELVEAGYHRKRGRVERAEALRTQAQQLPAVAIHDPDYRRLKYVRYADDFLLGFVGPKAEAEDIKHQLRQFLREELKLELSEDKTLIPTARRGAAKFLGYEVTTLQANDYRLAYNLGALNKLRWVLETSLLKTLAGKFSLPVSQVVKKYEAELVPDGKKYKGFQLSRPRQEKKPLVATWGGVPLTWDRGATLEEGLAIVHDGVRSELVQRLLAEVCELCGSSDEVQVHHVRKMSDLHEYPGRPKPPWVVRMIALRRKTLLLCRTCHQDVD